MRLVTCMGAVALWVGLAAGSGVAGDVASEGNAKFVDKEEFQKFLAEFEKFKLENRQLKTENTRLKQDVDGLKAQKRIGGLPIGSGPEPRSAPEVSVKGLQSRSGTTKFLMGGYMKAGLYDPSPRARSTFFVEFAPNFLWKLSDQISAESELEIESKGNGTTLNMDTANLTYHFHDYLTFRAGKFFSPFGRFAQHYYQPWINKMQNRPYIYDGGTGLVAKTTLGAMLQGGFDAGPTKFNWAAFASQGPRLDTSTARFGTLQYDNWETDNNQNKAAGGRLGFLPIPELELGGSLKLARVGADTPNVNDVAAHAALWGVDMGFKKEFAPLMGTVDIRAEWVWSRVGYARYAVASPPILFDDNRRDGGYLQFAYRPTKAGHKWLKNFEVAYRYDRIDNPPKPLRAPAASTDQFKDRDRHSLALNYWLGPTSVLKFQYQADTRDDKRWLWQYAIGF